MSERVLIAKPRVWRDVDGVWQLRVEYLEEGDDIPYNTRLGAMSGGRVLAMTHKCIPPSAGHRWIRDYTTTPPVLIEVPL